jgi:uncharacterized protein YecE (DUF72 family)
MIFIGTSGYNYTHWGNDVFYPSELPEKKWLEFYATYFNTVELNVTFYRLPTKKAFESWYMRTPSQFLFSIKGSRFITHIKRLKDCQEPLALFLDRASCLKEKLGVILWQLPPRFKVDLKRLEEFFLLISKIPISKKIPHAFEFRDDSWFCSQVFMILERFNFSFCISHGSGIPMMEKITSNIIYLRLHGGKLLYGSNYSENELKNWAKKIQSWKENGKIIFVYFNNDAYGFAIKNAMTLKRLLGIDE